MAEITTRQENNNSHFLIDSTLGNVNRLFLLSSKNGNNNPTRNYFDKYYMSLVEIKDFTS